jgi:hypothetical protein
MVGTKGSGIACPDKRLSGTPQAGNQGPNNGYKHGQIRLIWRTPLLGSSDEECMVTA